MVFKCQFAINGDSYILVFLSMFYGSVTQDVILVLSFCFTCCYLYLYHNTYRERVDMVQRYELVNIGYELVKMGYELETVRVDLFPLLQP